MGILSNQRLLGFLKDYKPLLVILLFSGVLAVVVGAFGPSLAPAGGSLQDQTNHTILGYGYRISALFMGYFFLLLSLFKFFDIPGFVKGFSTYDLLAKRWAFYGYLYPFIEFSLGVGYLVMLNPVIINGATLIVMIFSGLGVTQGVLFSDKKIKCACLGTAMNVPLGAISIVENFGMAAMALYHLLGV